jgi:hypothetical protein
MSRLRDVRVGSLTLPLERWLHKARGYRASGKVGVSESSSCPVL